MDLKWNRQKKHLLFGNSIWNELIVRECFIRLQVSIEMIRPSLPEQEANHIINAGYKFAKKRFDQEFRWELSAELEATIFKAIFG